MLFMNSNANLYTSVEYFNYAFLAMSALAVIMITGIFGLINYKNRDKIYEENEEESLEKAIEKPLFKYRVLWNYLNIKRSKSFIFPFFVIIRKIFIPFFIITLNSEPYI